MKVRTIFLSALLVSGCAQESNPLLFGTTTSVGVAINAGSGTDISPGITVGYGREEVAIVPTVVPNDTELAGTDSRVILAGASNDRKDALSTFANFNNNNTGTGGQGTPLGVSIGSTFATGIAAQYVSLGYLCSLGKLTEAQCKDAVTEAATLALVSE